ncbi:MAG TPA: hypothetical protein DEA55_11200 [Rhodospirillaceae bacterium]|nr:hypothetical protein [Rhodospirillaceae bacterium]
MNLSYYNPSDRYRRRNMQRIAWAVRTLAMLFFTVGFGFWIGHLYNQQKVVTLQAERDLLMQQRDAVQEDITRIRAEAQTANAMLAQARQNYEETIPAGPMRDIMALVKKQLEEGMDPQRLMMAVQSARPPRNCTEIETRRFMVSTPAYEGPDSKITVAEGKISISGKGFSAKNDKGEVEAWYDPLRAVNLVFSVEGSAAQKIDGVMPLHHSVVVEDKEYRFTVSQGAQSFAKVTFDSCDYP